MQRPWGKRHLCPETCKLSHLGSKCKAERLDSLVSYVKAVRVLPGRSVPTGDLVMNFQRTWCLGWALKDDQNPDMWKWGIWAWTSSEWGPEGPFSPAFINLTEHGLCTGTLRHCTNWWCLQIDFLLEDWTGDSSEFCIVGGRKAVFSQILGPNNHGVWSLEVVGCSWRQSL